MPQDHFLALPRLPGWKYEYVDGNAYIEPLPHLVYTKITVAPSNAQDINGILFRTITSGDIDRLKTPYADAFENTVEYFGKNRAEVLESADDVLNRFFRGEDGRPVPGFLAETCPDDGISVVGAALAVKTDDYYMLDMLFVRPARQRQSVAASLLYRLMNMMYMDGAAQLISRYNLANIPSRNWHRKQGFKDLPDLQLARIYHYHAVYEQKRQTKLQGPLSDEEKQRLQSEIDIWHNEIERLEIIAETEGYGAVIPVLTYS